MIEETKELNAVPQLGAEIQWRNSANALCNYMKRFEYLQMILEKQAIIPRYVIEPLGYLRITGVEQLAFPMTCFCDIPLSKVAGHMSKYGRYGIAFNKATVMNKFRLQPIHYINSNFALE